MSQAILTQSDCKPIYPSITFGKRLRPALGTTLVVAVGMTLALWGPWERLPLADARPAEGRTSAEAAPASQPSAKTPSPEQARKESSSPAPTAAPTQSQPHGVQAGPKRLQQVAISVRVVEWDRTAAAKLDTDETSRQTPGQVLRNAAAAAQSNGFGILPAADAAGLSREVAAMEKRGVARLLGEPKAATISGRRVTMACNADTASATGRSARAATGVVGVLPEAKPEQGVHLEVTADYLPATKKGSTRSSASPGSRAIATTITLEDHQTLAFSIRPNEALQGKDGDHRAALLKAFGVRQDTASSHELLILVTAELVQPTAAEPAPLLTERPSTPSSSRIH